MESFPVYFGWSENEEYPTHLAKVPETILVFYPLKLQMLVANLGIVVAKKIFIRIVSFSKIYFNYYFCKFCTKLNFFATDFNFY